MSLKQRVVKLERQRCGGLFILLETDADETVDAALARKGIVPRAADFILVHAGFERERESAA